MIAQVQATAAPPDVRAQLDGLPDKMKQAKQWLLWRSEGDPGSTKKPRKKPYYWSGAPRGAGIRLDSPEDAAQLCTFEEAITAFESERYSGLGFALGPDGEGGCWQGVDLDGLSKEERLRFLADELPGYTETSPSGDGRHAIGYGRNFATLGSNGSGIEAYCTGRFFTVTGDMSGIGEICDLAPYVELTLAPLHGSKATPATARGEVEIATDLAEQIEVLSPQTIRDLREALYTLDPNPYKPWSDCGQRLKSLGNVGRSMWMGWSAQSPKFDAAEAARKWESFKGERTSYRAIFSEAQRQGWLNPASGVGLLGTGQVTDLAPCPDVIASHLIDLDEASEITSDHPHVVGKILPEGEVTLLAGHGGSGKSFVALGIAIHVCLGIPIGGLIARQGPVLFFSAEDGKEELLRRTAAICKKLGRRVEELKGLLHLLDASEIEPSLYGPLKHQRGSMKPLADELATLVGRCEAVFVVIDNASDTYDAEENVRADVRAFVRGLRQKMARPNRAVLLLAHVNKLAAEHAGGKSYTQDYSGSTAWHNSARSRLSLESIRGRQALVHKKANRGPLAEPIGVVWQDAVPLLVDDGGGHLWDELARQADEQAVARNGAAVLRLIEDFTVRGEAVPTAERGRRTTFAVLSSGPEFPKSLDAPKLRNVIRELERQGRVRREVRRAPNRKEVEVFAAIFSSPSPPRASEDGSIAEAG